MSSDYSSHYFNQDLLDLFSAKQGAYSLVTGPEAEKGHITTAGPEAELIESFMGKDNIHVGPKKDDPAAATCKFNIEDADDIKEVNLTLVYPKPAKNELHIYLSKNQGFRPGADDVWFVYSRDGYNALFLGSMSQAEWASLTSTTPSYQSELKDDEVYQNVVNAPVTPKTQKLVQTLKYPRDAKVAIECMEISGFKCEFDPHHKTFLNKQGRPYMECHHLIPLSRQRSFKVSLDVHANIVIVCPNCHRCIHHAEKKSRDFVLANLHALRREPLKASGLDMDEEDLLSIYDLM